MRPTERRRCPVGISKYLCILAGLLIACTSPQTERVSTVKIAFIDALSGPFAATGENELNSYRYAIDDLKERGRLPSGTRFEVVPFDNKGSPEEAVGALQRAIDQGIHFITQGLGSTVTLALVDAIARHNAQHPQHAVVLLNYGANDPSLTNQRCSFWHFRFDADADMRMAALT